MKKVLVTFVLALTAALAQGASSAQPAQQPATSDQANVPTNQKVIKDPAEYNAYITALNTQDPTAKAQAMEAFINQYPNSIVKMDAMTQAMSAYQQAGNQQKVEETANKILQLDPNNVRALAIVTFIERSKASPATFATVRADGEKGLKALATWQKPEGTTQEDFEKLKNQMTEIFAGAAGFGALQAKDYPAARDYYTKSVQLDPANLQDIYQLGIADLEMNPMDVKGFWYIAKAYNMAGAQGQPTIGAYGKAKYKKFHGSVDGWDQILAATAAQTAPPADFAIKPAPTECEIAADATKTNDPAALSFSDWEFVLSHRDCSPDAGESAKKVWEAIQAKQKDAKGGEVKIKMQKVKIISATKDSIDAALTDENQAANKADMHLVMEKPMLKPPAPGSSIDIIGVFTSYTLNPFLFIMEKGELPAPPKAKTPPKKGPAHRPAARKKT